MGTCCSRLPIDGCVVPVERSPGFDSGAGLLGVNSNATAQRIEEIILRMQKIQAAIKSSGQPPSMLELGELKELGNEYARLVDDLGSFPQGTGLA